MIKNQHKNYSYQVRQLNNVSINGLDIYIIRKKFCNDKRNRLIIIKLILEEAKKSIRELKIKIRSENRGVIRMVKVICIKCGGTAYTASPKYSKCDCGGISKQMIPYKEKLQRNSQISKLSKVGKEAGVG